MPCTAMFYQAVCSKFRAGIFISRSLASKRSIDQSAQKE